MLTESHARQLAWLKDSFGLEFAQPLAKPGETPPGWTADDLLAVIEVSKEEVDATFDDAVRYLKDNGQDPNFILNVFSKTLSKV